MLKRLVLPCCMRPSKWDGDTIKTAVCNVHCGFCVTNIQIGKNEHEVGNLVKKLLQ